MELQNFLNEALKDEFKAHATVEALGKMVETKVEELTWKKHRDEKLYNDGLEYQLFKVKARFFVDKYSINESGVNLVLYYFCSSNLPKAKRDKIEEVKLNLDNNRWFLPYCNYKIPLWKDLNFVVNSDKIFSNSFGLQIE